MMASADLSNPEGSIYAEEIMAEKVSTGLEDMIAHLFPRSNTLLRDGHTFSMRSGDRVVCSWTD